MFEDKLKLLYPEKNTHLNRANVNIMFLEVETEIERIKMNRHLKT